MLNRGFLALLQLARLSDIADTVTIRVGVTHDTHLLLVKISSSQSARREQRILSLAPGGDQY